MCIWELDLIKFYLQGEEAPESLLDSLGKLSPVGCDDLVTEGSHTSTVLGKKIYVVGGPFNDDESSINVKVFDKLTGKWRIPTVLGPKPTPSEGYSAILLNNERILILKWDCSLDDSIWFLEVDTPYVKEQNKLLGTEVVAWSKGFIGDGALPVVITGPSGVGKGTLISKLMKEFPSTFGFSVSHTTRAPREKEINGVHYHFTERIIMEKDIKDGKFLESASVHGNLYGTSMEAVEAVKDIGKRCILDIDVQGARSVRASPLEALFIFICPPSFEELEKRLRARGTESEEQVQKRLRNAIAEIDQRNSAGLFDHILVNDDLESCYQELKKLLALEDGTDASYQHSVKNLRIPLNPPLSKTGQKIMVCSISDRGIEHSISLVFDVSSLKGGAPGRTRGINTSVFDS